MLTRKRKRVADLHELKALASWPMVAICNYPDLDITLQPFSCLARKNQFNGLFGSVCGIWDVTGVVLSILSVLNSLEFFIADFLRGDSGQQDFADAYEVTHPLRMIMQGIMRHPYFGLQL